MLRVTFPLKMKGEVDNFLLTLPSASPGELKAASSLRCDFFYATVSFGNNAMQKCSHCLDCKTQSLDSCFKLKHFASFSRLGLFLESHSHDYVTFTIDLKPSHKSTVLQQNWLRHRHFWQVYIIWCRAKYFSRISSKYSYQPVHLRN